jgi:hypothetical protein
MCYIIGGAIVIIIGLSYWGVSISVKWIKQLNQILGYYEEITNLRCTLSDIKNIKTILDCSGNDWFGAKYSKRLDNIETRLKKLEERKRK